ncbi:mechanosensitive ion channel family protein [Nocardiopsis coralliicola]
MPTADLLNSWFAENSGALLSGAVNIVLVLVLAAVARAVVGRLITALTKRYTASQERLRQTAGGKRLAAPAGSLAAERQRARAETIGAVLRSCASFVIFGIALFMVLGEIGIDLAPLLASAGVLGLAIGFGAQGLVKDFVSGMALMLEDQFGVGDTVDLGEAIGTVEDVGLRITKVRDANGGLWFVRNGEILRVCNMNQDWAAAVVDLPVAASVDPDRAEATVQRAADEFAASGGFDEVLMEPPAVSGVVDISGGVMTVRVTVKTLPGRQAGAATALRTRIKRALDEDGIAMSPSA